MKQNTKLFFLLLLCVPLFFSCNKDDSDDSGYYFKFKMNGNWITWKEALADLVTQSGQTEFSLSSRNEGATEYIYMLINPNNGANLVPGIYTPDNSLLKVSYVKHISATGFTNYSMSLARRPTPGMRLLLHPLLIKQSTVHLKATI